MSAKWEALLRCRRHRTAVQHLQADLQVAVLGSVCMPYTTLKTMQAILLNTSTFALLLQATSLWLYQCCLRQATAADVLTKQVSGSAVPTSCLSHSSEAKTGFRGTHSQVTCPA